MRRTKIDREMGFVRICFKKQRGRRKRGGFGLDVNFQATFLKNLAILYWMYQVLVHWNSVYCINEGTFDEFLNINKEFTESY